MPKIRFDVLTIFPSLFDCFLNESIINKAIKKGILKIDIHDVRNYITDKHKVVDDRPYGGGIGMVLKIDPFYNCLKSICRFKVLEKAKTTKKIEVLSKNTKIVLLGPRGKKFNQKKAYEYSKLNRLIMVAGRYEGIDERIKYLVDEEISIGDFVVMGGEVPAMMIIEAVSRLIPGVLGKPKLLDERITEDKGFIEYPQYTRPSIFEPKKGVKWEVPKVLLTGDHKKIAEWRQKKGKVVK
ncbi:tRNA (guanine-N(1)-)-methyltransferase [bacterium HR34]|nr:tRNA (guanine-N(1)-)-methyltransferase [bacterium HR34]